MRPEDCFQVGYIRKTHGLQGAVELILDVDYPEEYSEMESFLIRFPEGMVPFFVKRMRLHGNRAITEFKGADTESTREMLVGKEVWLPLSLLPALDSPQAFYYHELPGMEVEDVNTGQNRGVVVDVYEYGSNVLIEVKGPDGKLHLFPIPEELLEGVDRAAKKIRLRIPEGL